MGQLSFTSFTPKMKNIRAQIFLTEMNQVMPWERFASLIEPFYPKAGKGRRPIKLLLMLKIYCLQQWYNLSDPLMEETIYDRISFQKFLDIDLISDVIPDETTILNFRHLLEKYDLTKKIFQEINKYLSEKALIMKKGSIVDATIIHSSHSTKNKERKRDPEMSSTRKNNQYYFGMKAHIGVDYKNALVHTCEFTTANTPDHYLMTSLLHGKEKAIFGDKGYVKNIVKKSYRKAGVYWGILDKAHHPRKLTNKQKSRNRKLTGVRSKVEFPFRIIKCLWGHYKTRYKGMYKNACQWRMLLGLTNIYRMRKKLIAV